MVVKYKDVTGDMTGRFDAVIIGTGAAGPVAAARLAKAGLSVAMVEEGGYYTSRDFTSNAPDMVAKLYRNAGILMLEGKPNIAFSEGCCVGGGTVVNAGVSWRTPEDVLEKWGRDFGIEEATPAVMEQYFEEIEERISVRPQDEESLGRDLRLFRDGSVKMGFRTIPVKRNQVHCCGCNNCILGCPADAKQSTLVTYVPDAMEAGAALYTNCRIDRIIMKEGRAAGVEGSFRLPGRTRSGNGAGNGRPYKLRLSADAVILACGALETPALLLRSGFKSRPIGRNLFIHPNVKGVGVFPDDIYGWKGTAQGWQVHEFLDRGILMATTHVPLAFLGLFNRGLANKNFDEASIYNRMLICGLLSEDTTTGRVTVTRGGRTRARYQITALDIERFKEGLVHLADLLFAAGADRMALPFRQLTEITKDEGTAPIKNVNPKPGDVEVLTVHAMGTTGMGSDPSVSAVDPFGKLHGAPNIFVVDASLFPSAVKVNPMLSIMAFAARNADHIIDGFPRLRIG